METAKALDDGNDISMKTVDHPTSETLEVPANVSDSDDKSSDEGEPMDIDEKKEKIDDDFADVIDQAKLCRQMVENKKGGDKIAGKDIGLFIGETGAGKVSCCHRVEAI